MVDICNHLDSLSVGCGGEGQDADELRALKWKAMSTVAEETADSPFATYCPPPEHLHIFSADSGDADATAMQLAKRKSRSSEGVEAQGGCLPSAGAVVEVAGVQPAHVVRSVPSLSDLHVSKQLRSLVGELHQQ